MTAKDWHEFADGYRFQETTFGPCVDRECVDCGEITYATPDWLDPRCEECSIRLRGVLRPAERIRERAARGKLGPVGAGGVPLAVTPRDPTGGLAPHPAPETPCRFAAHQEMGRRALALQGTAQTAGWRVQATYARGWGVHGRTGKPTSVSDSIAVRCWGPGGRRMVLCWVNPGKAWKQSLGIRWSPELPLENISFDVAISWIRDTVATADRPCDKTCRATEGETMPQKIDNQEINLFEAGSGKRAYGKISWAQYTDGEVWRFDRDPDWTNVKTAGQVIDMAKRFANREGYKLEYRSETDTVWVKLTKLDQPAPAETEGDPFQGESEMAEATA